MINQQILKNGGAEQKVIDDLVSAWTAYQRAREQPIHKLPHIVCTGIYNAGKSTLLNVLLDTQQFPTGDIPTTKKVAQAEFGGAVYVDTPGLNAMESDDKETENAYKEADVYLFVSNAQNGGVSEQEAKWLRGLKERHADETALQRRLVYVLSQCGNLEPETVEKVREKVRSDLQSVLGMCPEQIFCVDAHTYRDGKSQNEKILVEASGIPVLRDSLKGKISESAKSLADERAQEIRLRQDAVFNQLAQIEVSLMQIQKKEHSVGNQTAEEIMRMWESFETELEKVTPSGKDINPFSAPYISLNYRYETGENKSFNKAWRAMKSMLEPYRNAQQGVLDKAIAPIMREIREKYSSMETAENSV